MPDELLIDIENEIIERYTDKLKEILFSDNKISKADTIYASMDIDIAKKKYNRLYPTKV